MVHTHPYPHMHTEPLLTEKTMLAWVLVHSLLSSLLGCKHLFKVGLELLIRPLKKLNLLSMFFLIQTPPLTFTFLDGFTLCLQVLNLSFKIFLFSLKRLDFAFHITLSLLSLQCLAHSKCHAALIQCP